MWTTKFEKHKHKDTIGDLICIWNSEKEDEFRYTETVNLDIKETIDHVLRNAMIAYQNNLNVDVERVAIDKRHKKIISSSLKRITNKK